MSLLIQSFINILNNIQEYTDSIPIEITHDNINEKMINHITKTYISKTCFIINNDLLKKCIIANDNVGKFITFLDNRIKSLIEEEKQIDKIYKRIKISPIEYKDFIEIYSPLIDFIIENKWVELLFEELEPDKITDEAIIEHKQNATNFAEIKKLHLRINQINAIEILELNGLQTGIHCQATGSGKSIIFLKYIDYFIKNKIKGNIILFTERVNILADLFGFKTAKGIDLNLVDENNKKEWKRLNIVDLDNIDVINRVTVKCLDWDKLLTEDSIKPKLLVINRAYLTRPKMYKKIIDKHIGMILHDECHSSTSNLCYDFLVHCKKYNIPTIGFSATPLRTGTSSSRTGVKTESNIQKLLNIYGIEKEKIIILNLLTNYSMINSISCDLILPPKFYWYLFDKTNTSNVDDMKIKHVTEQDIAIIIKILWEVLEALPNRKIIAWCGTISMAESWQKKFIEYKEKPLIKELCPELLNFEFYIDHSKNFSDYVKFKDCKSDAIMFCANKHREGSDIKYLDCCMFLDKVINRTAIPFIQSIGRVLRKEENKSYGVVIDGFAKDSNNYEKEMIDKIIGYYMALSNLANNDTTKYEHYVKILNLVEFDKENKIIKLKFNTQQIVINCNKLEWGKIIEKFEPILQDKIKLSIGDNFRHKALILKTHFNFNLNTDFVVEYNDISSDDKIKYNLPDINDDEYLKLFGKKTWLQFLELEHNYYETKQEAINGLNKLKIKLINPKDKWKSWCKKDKRLPPYPVYLWDDFNWSDFIDKPKLMFI